MGWPGWSASPSSTGATASAKILDTEYEYLRTARATTDFHGILAGWVARIPYDGLPDNIADANWPVHVAGHPPGALGFFVVLDRIGLGSGLQAGIVVTLLAASTALAVLVTLRRWAPRSWLAAPLRSWSSGRPPSGSA